MILPTKHIREDRSLIGIGAEILFLLNMPKTVSALWNDIQKNRQAIELASTISFDWFVLALDFLYSINAINFSKGKVWRSE